MSKDRKVILEAELADLQRLIRELNEVSDRVHQAADKALEQIKKEGENHARNDQGPA